MATVEGTPTQATQTTMAANWLSPSELRILEAVCEALIPAVSPPQGADDPDGYYARSAKDLGTAQLIAEALSAHSAQMQGEFKQLLGLMNSPAFGLLLAGRFRGFTQLSPQARETALRRMSTSSVARLRQGFQALKRLTGFVYFGAPIAEGANPNWPALGFTPPPPPPSLEAAPKTIRTLDVTGDLTLTADVVIVGSGAGGGVVAGELTAAGKDVVILEKGGYFGESDFTGYEAEMMPELFLRRGLLTNDDLSMLVLAGSSLGGGTVINWSASLRTPPDVLEEWERDYGLTGTTSAEYLQGFEAVERRIGVNSDDCAPNRNNATLQHGCEAIGYEWGTIPRNASDCHQRCGYCNFGCPYGRKQSTMRTYLQDASDRGARILVRCQAERVLTDHGQVSGVEGWALETVTGQRRKVVVRAPTVVVAAGSVESPALLLRSGLTNPNIGKHLRLHPVAAVAGYYAEPVETWTGSPMTIYTERFARLQGGYGFRLEAMPAHAGLLGLAAPWEGGQAYKQLMARIAHQAVYIVLTRDTGEGSVTLDKGGEPIVHYWPNETDRRHLIRGMQELTRIVFAGGGTGVSHNFTPRLALEAEGGKPGAVSDARLNRFLQEIEARDIVRNRVLVGTAHQMGSCRLGGSAKLAVADPDGQVYGVRGLYIADASGFPTASGVNPMLSTMVLAYHVAQRVKRG
jgi:choline dehydrogenase-like flavoprotein